MLALSVFLLACMHVVIAQNEKIPECMFGKNVIVHLNGWKYSEIQKECEAAETRFYCAIQVASCSIFLVTDLKLQLFNIFFTHDLNYNSTVTVVDCTGKPPAISTGFGSSYA